MNEGAMKTKPDLPKGKPILSIDFDGVLHSYKSGWQGARNIPDPPVPGAIAWLKELVYDQRDPFVPRHADFDVCIFSSRNRYWGGAGAMRRFLMQWGMSAGEIEAIRFPLWKPPSFLHIDDRAVQFAGKFPSVTELLAFQPWHKKRPSPSIDPCFLMPGVGLDPSFLMPRMGPVIASYEDQQVVYGEEQPQYIPLPALSSHDKKMRVLTRWSPSAEQRRRIAEGEDLLLELVTFGSPLQPIRMFLPGNWMPSKLLAWWRNDMDLAQTETPQKR